MEADSLISKLNLISHPEGGHYAENFKNDNVSQIYYLLKKNEKSHWHRLTKNEIFKMYFVFFLMIVNSILEVISIGALLPLLSIMMDNQLNISFMSKFFSVFENFDIKIDIYLIVIFLLSTYIIKYLFTLYFIKEQAKFILRLKSHLSTRVFGHVLKKKYKFFMDNTSANLVRNVKQEVEMYVNGFVSPILSLILAFSPDDGFFT